MTKNCHSLHLYNDCSSETRSLSIKIEFYEKFFKYIVWIIRNFPMGTTSTTLLIKKRCWRVWFFIGEVKNLSETFQGNLSTSWKSAFKVQNEKNCISLNWGLTNFNIFFGSELILENREKWGYKTIRHFFHTILIGN